MSSTQQLGWALVHFLWQGALIAIAARLLLALVTSAGARYWISVAALVSMPLAVLGTAAGTGAAARAYPPVRALVPEDPERPAAAPIVDASPAPSPSPSAAPSPIAATGADLRARLDAAMPLLVIGWLVGVALLAMRLLGGLVMTRRLVRQHVEPVGAATQAMLGRLMGQLGVRRAVTVLSSGVARVPAVIGWLRPVILLPASALTGLAPAQLEIILAHELAHIRRHDYLVNLAQAVIETLLFYHPGVWWLGARIREEREHCCDDLAVRIAGSPVAYAEALLSLETLRGAAGLAVAATGGSLVSRVERLLGVERRDALPRWAAGAIVALMLVAGGAAIAQTSDAPETMPAAERPPATDFAHLMSPKQDPRALPDTVIMVPAAGTLEDRIGWARAHAARRGRGYWLGWSVAPLPRLAEGFLMGRFDNVGGLTLTNATIDGDVTISGRTYGRIVSRGSLRGFQVPGQPLSTLAGADPASIGLLYLYERGAGPRLVRVHASTASVPVHFERKTLYWLGHATDEESLGEAQARFLAATGQMREDLVGMMGLHAASNLTVPVLAGLLESGEPRKIRESAAEWLGAHDTRDAVAVLARTARGDVVGDVRREAAEAIGDIRLREALDTLIVLARALDDREARREAVEAMGQREEREVVGVLLAIANDDPDDETRREAVETLGELKDGRGRPALESIGRSHSDPEARREALEAFIGAASPPEAFRFLRERAWEDRDPDVQREAVETMGEASEEISVVAELERIARTHPVIDVRREAVETLGERYHHERRALDVLRALARSALPPDVEREVQETLREVSPDRSNGK